jgi:hypothetical protein
VAIRSLKFVLTGEDKSASKAMDKAGRNADRLGSKLGTLGGKGVGGAIGLAGKAVGGLALGIGAAGVAAVGLAPSVLKMSAALEQSAAKAQTVFGPQQVGNVQKWAAANAAAMGLTKSEATGLAANFGDLLIPMGFTREQAAKMSTDVVGLSGALSQWSGGTKSAAEVSEILAAAMLGETDSLKSLGIAIGAADIEARLLKNGQDKLTGAALEQAKALATQQLIMEKSTDAQAAYKTSGGTLLGQQAKLTATFKELREKGVKALTPVLGRLMGGVSNLIGQMRTGTGTGGKLREAFEKIAQKFKENRPQIQALAETFGKVAFFVGSKVVPAFLTLASEVPRIMIMIGNAAVNGFGMLLDAAAKAFGWIPGLGPKLKAANQDFQKFREKINEDFRKLEAERTMTIRIKTVEEGVKSGDYGLSEAGMLGALARGGSGVVVPKGQAVVTRPIGRNQALAADRTITVNVQVDKKTIASAVANGNAQNARRGAKTAAAR